jgi:hypothetical protein
MTTYRVMTLPFGAGLNGAGLIGAGLIGLV